MKAIEVDQITKIYRGKKRQKVEALKGVSLQVEPGQVYGFLGPNGAGKSTTIKILVGQIKMNSGSASLYGQPVGDSRAREKVGYLPENPAFYDFLTAYEYLELVGRSFGMEEKTITSEAERVLELLTLTEASRRPIRGYSKGMVQRLGIAQTLLHDPDLYILDEPMSGLDPVGRAHVKQIIADLKKKGKTVFFSTHVIADVEAVCDRVGIVAAGRLQADYDVAQVLRDGIEGHHIQVSGCTPEAFEGFEVSCPREGGPFSVLVPMERHQEFMKQLYDLGGRVEFIEPQRRSLEALFLKSIDQE